MTIVKEEYPTISLVLDKIKYMEHKWVLCVDIKMINFLLGQQGGYTKYLVSYAYGTAELKLNIGLEDSGRLGRL